MENIEETLATLKETLIFLVEQEKVRAEEIKALNEKIDAVNDAMVNQIINPAIEQYQEEQFGEFKEKYGEKLGKYDDLLRKSLNEPEYDSTRETWNKLNEMSDEEREGLNVDDYVDNVENGFKEYVADIKEQLGIAPDTAMEISDDGNGNLEVKADTNGDGTPDEVVSEESSEVVTEETPAEEENVDEESDEDTIDPELEKELAAYAEK